VEVKEHPFYRRHGNDLHGEISITYPQAVLGSKVEVPVIGGSKEMKIPSGTQPGTTLRMKGLGMPDIRYPKRTGDIFIIVNIDVPKHPSLKEKRAIKKLHDIQGDNKRFDI